MSNILVIVLSFLGRVCDLTAVVWEKALQRVHQRVRLLDTQVHDVLIVDACYRDVQKTRQGVFLMSWGPLLTDLGKLVTFLIWQNTR